MTKPKRVLTLAIMPVLLVPASLFAEEGYPGYGYEPTAGEHIGEREYLPYLDIGYPQRVFWGDTHLHTSYSTGAGMTGSTDSHTSLATTEETTTSVRHRWPSPQTMSIASGSRSPVFVSSRGA